MTENLPLIERIGVFSRLRRLGSLLHVVANDALRALDCDGLVFLTVGHSDVAENVSWQFGLVDDNGRAEKVAGRVIGGPDLIRAPCEKGVSPAVGAIVEERHVRAVMNPRGEVRRPTRSRPVSLEIVP